MNELQIFNFGQQELRTQLIDGEPWLLGKDVADSLGYQNGSRDINRHVDNEDRKIITIFDGNQNREMIFINESGMFSLVFGSKLKVAKKFKRWVTSEVLPAIRKTGFYQLPTEPEDIMIETLKSQKDIKANLKLVQDDVEDLKQEINLSRSQKHHLAAKVRINVYNALGGKKAQSYNDRNLRARLYSNHWREIKNYFDVEAYEEIPKLKFDEAVEFAELWEPSTELKMLIKEKNNQIPLVI
ncbi:ORF6C domain-containing protein [Carnobacterium pleistocenium]|uniref:ORF6C domain-containing protein n=1 Tax=Carnobacterium pleistocenium TaxID=181073 RepID=UPI000553F004|nr:ORF6C domain-containing protein [Carnobacterium pleistocenium]